MAAREAHALLVAIHDYMGAYGHDKDAEELVGKLKEVEAQVSGRMDSPAQAPEPTPGKLAADVAAQDARKEREERPQFKAPDQQPKNFEEAGQEARRRFAGENRLDPFGQRQSKSSSTRQGKNPPSPQKDQQQSSSKEPASNEPAPAGAAAE